MHRGGGGVEFVVMSWGTPGDVMKGLRGLEGEATSS